jgi:hypothetical protein
VRLLLAKTKIPVATSIRSNQAGLYLTEAKQIHLTVHQILTMPPVAIAISRSVFLRLSPKPGALTAQTCSPTFILSRKKQNFFELHFCTIFFYIIGEERVALMKIFS